MTRQSGRHRDPGQQAGIGFLDNTTDLVGGHAERAVKLWDYDGQLD